MSVGVSKLRNLEARSAPNASPRWLIYYYLVLFACQLALLAGVLSSARFIFRAATYGMSLGALASTATSPGRKSPLAPFAVGVLAILTFEIVNPGTPSGVAALATIAMYLAILAPVFWVPRLAIDLSWFRRTVILIWAFQASSALIGVLQVYFPGQFAPAVSSLLSDDYVSSLKITLANGERILRPSGLTDTPGGAAGAGTYTILLALGLWSDKPKPLLRVLLAISMGLGMFTIYICQIRSLVVMLGLSLTVAMVVTLMRGRIRRSVSNTALILAVGAVAFVAAAAVGGDEMTKRLATLTQSTPTDVYYTNRGIFLEQTLTDLLPRYPFGAGLARWGMVASYFGGTEGSTAPIYVEIQWTGWLLDGGVPLITAYVGAITATLWSVWRLSKTPEVSTRADVSTWAVMLLAYDVGAIALTFNVPVFMSNFGLDFWLLNAAFLAAAGSPAAQQLSN